MIDILPEHLKLIKKILNEYLPAKSQVWVFGSRAQGTAQKFSDLDLLIDANGESLPVKITIDLKEAFEESLLPYKVDLVDWNMISEEFRNNIKNQRVLI